MQKKKRDIDAAWISAKKTWRLPANEESYAAKERLEKIDKALNLPMAKHKRRIIIVYHIGIIRQYVMPIHYMNVLHQNIISVCYASILC